MTKSNFDKMAKAPLFARPPRPDEDASSVVGYGAVRAADGRIGAPDRPHGAICDRRLG